MELIKKNIHMNQQTMQATGQITLDEDFNVPDNRKDIERIIIDGGKIKIEEIKSAQDHVVIRGILQFYILYIGDNGEQQIHSLEGRIPFEETLNMDGLEASDTVNLKSDLEDLSISIVNSRKLDIKALIAFEAFVEDVYDEEVVMEIVREGVQTKSVSVPVLQMVMHKKDNCRVKDEILLSSNKANIFELLWSSIQPRNVEAKQMENQLSIHGELQVLAIYTSEEENRPIQMMEEVVPFHNTIECAGCSADSISFITWNMNQKDLEVKSDFDGEERSFGIECMMELDIKLYEEEDTKVVEDVYSVVEDLNPVMGEFRYPRLLIRNQSIVRLSDHLRIRNSQGRIMQIVHVEGEAKVEEVEKREDGFEIQGILDLQVFYVTGENEPFETIKGAVPFELTIEVPNMPEETECFWQAGLEQLSAMAVDGEEVEIKAIVNFNILAQSQESIPTIRSIEASPLDLQRLEELPGIIGYIADGKKSLWEIAKEHAVTVDELWKNNDLSGENIKKGDKLIIIKSVGKPISVES